MLFVGCQTANHASQSLLHAAVAAGADCAIGFSTDITCIEANRFTEWFFRAYAEGKSIQEWGDSGKSAADFENGIVVVEPGGLYNEDKNACAYLNSNNEVETIYIKDNKKNNAE